MAAHKSTIINAPGNSTGYAAISWSSFDSGANNVYFDVNDVDASKLLILVAAHSTLPCRIWVGTSDSRSSHTSMAYPFWPNQGLGRFVVKTAAVSDGHARSIFKSTSATAGAGDTEVLAVYALGPFETARFKDSDGYINVCRGITTAGGASHSSDAQYIAGVLIP